MHVLVTGGSGLIGTAAVDALVAKGHTVRIVARNAERDVKRWPKGVDAWSGNVADAGSLGGACKDIDVVLHIAGIAREEPPELTFEAVNIEGTRNLAAAAVRSHVRRFVYVSSLGADRGCSDYHQSKRAAEAIARAYDGEWLIVRPGNVYGPGDEILSLLLRMVRTLPAVPVIDGGDQLFQPIWHEDLGAALAAAVERSEIRGTAVEIAGNELTSPSELIERFAAITGRRPARVPLPSFLAKIGAKAGSLLGADIPLDDNVLKMLKEENVVRDPAGNALTRLFGVEATPLERGLAKLADAMPEQLPSEGFGELKKKRFTADIAGSRMSATELMEHVRVNFHEITPLEFHAEPEAEWKLERGATLTGHMPLRGNFQMRIEEISPRHFTMMTLAGHPLAGAVSFFFDDHGERIFFEIRVVARAADLVDYVALKAGGAMLQDATWVRVAQRIVDDTGGTAVDGIQVSMESLSEEEATQVNAWMREIVQTRERDERKDAT